MSLGLTGRQNLCRYLYHLDVACCIESMSALPLQVAKGFEKRALEENPYQDLRSISQRPVTFNYQRPLLPP